MKHTGNVLNYLKETTHPVHQPSEEINFKNLPDELLIEIALYLDIKSLLALSMVSTRCHAIAYESMLWAQRFEGSFPEAYKTYQEKYKGRNINWFNAYLHEYFDHVFPQACFPTFSDKIKDSPPSLKLLDAANRILIDDDKGDRPCLHRILKDTKNEVHALNLFKKAIRAGVNINAVNPKGDTAAHKIASLSLNHANQFFEALVEAGADLNAKNNKGSTPAHMAAQKGWSETKKLRILHQLGASLDCQDNNGQTPLHLAASLNDIDLVYLFIQAGARLNIEDNAGNTPLSLAYRLGFFATDTTYVLLHHGARSKYWGILFKIFFSCCYLSNLFLVTGRYFNDAEDMRNCYEINILLVSTIACLLIFSTLLALFTEPLPEAIDLYTIGPTPHVRNTMLNGPGFFNRRHLQQQPRDNEQPDRLEHQPGNH